MKVGLYFGSFNPIHLGHLIIASHIVDNTDLQQIWMVLSPQNPLKKAKELLNENLRLYLLNLAIEDDPRLKASNVEFSLPKPSYTIDTLTYLTEKYPLHEFCVIMGFDSLMNLPKWKNYKKLIENYPILVYKRVGFDKIPDELTSAKKISIVDAPLLEISSTGIRKLIKEGKSIKYLIPDKAREQIEQYKYYKIKSIPNLKDPPKK